MLRAFADREDVRVAGRPQIVADDDAALDRQPGVARQRDVRADAGGHDHHLALEP